MKNLYILIFLSMCLSTAAVGQTYGVKAGWSLSNLATSNGDVESDGARNGFVAGVFANYPVGGLLSIQPELLYTQKGASYNNLDVGVNAQADYIDLPVSLQVNVLDPFYVYAGPQVSYLINSSVEFASLNGDNDIILDTDEGNYNRLDLGGVVGIGFKFEKMFLDARVSRGFIDYDKDRTFDSAVVEAKNLKNFNFQLTSGFMF